MRLPSASSLERAFACPPSQVYPHLRSAGSARWARRGTVIHRYLVRVSEVGVEKALEEVPPDFREACACIELEQLPAMDPSGYAFEVAVAWNLATDTARELGRNLERQEAYAQARPGELVGTMDVLGLTEDAVVVCDYKTGYRWFEAVWQNAQLMFYALAACRAYGRSMALLAIIRINEEGHPYFIRATVGAEELEAFAQSLRDLDDNIADLQLLHLGGEELQPVTGDHCQYCPAVHGCPAWMKLARAMTSPEDDKGGLPALNAETGPLYVEALKRGTKVLERIKQGLDAYATQNPIDLGGGWFYGLHPFPQREWNIEKALPVLARNLGEAAALRTVKAEVVEKQIYEAFRERKKVDPKLGMGKETERVMEALLLEGGLSIRHTFPVGRHKSTPEKVELVEKYVEQLELERLGLANGGEANGEAGGEEEAGERNGDASGEAA